METNTQREVAIRWWYGLPIQEANEILKKNEHIGFYSDEQIEDTWYNEVVKIWWDEIMSKGYQFEEAYNLRKKYGFSGQIVESEIKQMYLTEHQLTDNVTVVGDADFPKEENWEEAQEIMAYQSADMQDYENKTGSYTEPTNTLQQDIELLLVNNSSSSLHPVTFKNGYSQGVLAAYEMIVPKYKELKKSHKDLINSLDRIIKISDRNHTAWNEAKNISHNAKKLNNE